MPFTFLRIGEASQVKAAGGVVGSWGAVGWSFMEPLYTVLQIIALIAAIVASYATARYYFKKNGEEKEEE